MYWTGSGQSGAQDAEWITNYNGGHYATFDPPAQITGPLLRTPFTGWYLNATYVNAVCNTASGTI
jgi:hypothetical protein